MMIGILIVIPWLILKLILSKQAFRYFYEIYKDLFGNIVVVKLVITDVKQIDDFHIVYLIRMVGVSFVQHLHNFLSGLHNFFYHFSLWIA